MFNLLIIYSHILNNKNERFCVLKMNTESYMTEFVEY